MTVSTNPLIGIGLYSVQEAAAYTGIQPVKIRRWLNGYHDRNKRFHPALWPSPLGACDVEAVTFGDLLELRFVNAFRQHGVSLQAIRHAAEHAREYFQSPYPFTCHQFLTDGRHIFAEVREETGDDSIIDLARKQSVFASIIRPSLYSGIEYNDTGRASRWYPMTRNRRVLMDPDIAFGQPVVSESAVPTDALFQSWKAEEGDEQRVARLYDVAVADVIAAVKFEQGLLTEHAVSH